MVSTDFPRPRRQGACVSCEGVVTVMLLTGHDTTDNVFFNVGHCAEIEIFFFHARRTGFEPVTFGVTSRDSNQLS